MKNNKREILKKEVLYEMFKETSYFMKCFDFFFFIRLRVKTGSMFLLRAAFLNIKNMQFLLPISFIIQTFLSIG